MLLARNCSAWIASFDAGHRGPPYEMGRVAPGWRTYSQSYQDGLLQRIFSRLGSESTFFVEFGLGYTKDASELTDEAMDALQLNTRLLHKTGWNGVYFDALVESAKHKVVRKLLTRETIVATFQEAKVPTNVDYVSIDVDSIDAWLLHGLLESGIYRPRVISVEYNGNYLASDAITMNATWVPWVGRSLYGASAKAIVDIAERAGYRLLYLMSYFDAFLVRKDVLQQQCDPRSVPPLEEQARRKLHTKQHFPCRFPEQLRMVDVGYIFGELSLKTARKRADSALERAEARLSALRKRGARPTCCARTGSAICVPHVRGKA